LDRTKENWILYPSTCEHLRNERNLFFEKAGPYANLKPQEAQRALAERMGALTTAEQAKWIHARHHKGEMTMG
jgi:hypothetical protein